jgi:hypothetical protein
MLRQWRIAEECGVFNRPMEHFHPEAIGSAGCKRCRPLYPQREPQAAIAMEIG